MSRPDPREIAAVFVGGALGTVARAGLSELFPHGATHWPWPTFAVNIAGAFLLGYLATEFQKRPPRSRYQRPLWGTGLCGGLTTFSTMQLEIVQMIDAGAYGLVAAYAATSVVAGYAAVQVATAVARRMRIRG